MSHYQRSHATPEHFSDLVAAYYEQKASYDEQYNAWLDSQQQEQHNTSTLSTRNAAMPSHPAEETAGSAAGSTYFLITLPL